MAGAEKPITLAQKMAAFVFGLRYESIPDEVLAAARRHLADTLACALGAYHAPMILTLRKDAIATGGRAAATLIGTAETLPAASAALVNGAMVRYLDANDIFVSRGGGASGHFSDATAALLAVAEQYRRSGQELLTCLVASYELQGALAESLDFWERGLHPVANVAWTTPIVAARLIGTTPAQAVHACGLSVATGTVMNTWIRPSNTIPMIKSLAAGFASKRALESAELALIGMTATDDALETIFARWSQPGLRFDPVPLESLGRRWSSTRNMLKLYPAQINTQAAIEATLRLHRRGIRPEHIRKLLLYGHRHVAAGVQGSAQAFAPTSRESADHSTPYVIAMALRRGRLTLEEFEGTPWENADVKAVMAKIELIIDPSMDEAFVGGGVLGVRLAALLNDGRSEEIVVHQPKGHPDAPLSNAELREKISSLLVKCPAVAADDLLDLCNRLARVEDVEDLIESCNVER